MLIVKVIHIKTSICWADLLRKTLLSVSSTNINTLEFIAEQKLPHSAEPRVEVSKSNSFIRHKQCRTNTQSNIYPQDVVEATSFLRQTVLETQLRWGLSTYITLLFMVYNYTYKTVLR